MVGGREPAPAVYQVRSRPAGRTPGRALPRLRDLRRETIRRGLSVDIGPEPTAGAGTMIEHVLLIVVGALAVALALYPPACDD